MAHAGLFNDLDVCLTWHPSDKTEVSIDIPPQATTGQARPAKALATTIVDLFEDPKTLQAVQAEFREKTKGVVYKPFVPEGPPPHPKR